MTEHFTPKLQAAIAQQIARENELAAAVERRSAASNPLTRLLGRVSVW